MPSSSNLCGQKAHSIQLPLSSATEDESAASLAEAVRLQNLIDRLTEQRAELLRRVNNQKASTRNLPAEVLSTIFFLCQQPDFFDDPKSLTDDYDYDDYASPFVLGSVSSHWREVVQSTPHLWTSIRVEVRNENVHQVVSLLRHYLRNSGALGTTIDFDMEAQMKINSRIRLRPNEATDLTSNQAWSQGTQEPLEPIREVIFEELPGSVKALRLVCPPPEWFHEEGSIGDRFIKLRSVYLSWNIPDTSDDDYDIALSSFFPDFEALPWIREVWLRGLKSWEYNPIFQQNAITKLHLANMDYNLCIDLLLECENIVSFSMLSPYCDRDSRGPKLCLGPSGIFESRALKTLEWTFPFDSEYQKKDLLPVFSTPSLQTMIFHDVFHDNGAPYSGLIQFLSCLPPSCQSLHLVANAHFDYQLPLLELLQHIPLSVPYIRFSNPCTYYSPLIYEHKHSLSLALDDTGSRASSLISYDHNGVETRCDGCFCKTQEFTARTFLDAMKVAAKYRTGSDSIFRLEYDIDYMWIDWDIGSVQRRLKKLVKNGLGIEISKSGERVDWL